MTQNNSIIDKQAFLNNWQANRRLTRRVIDAFPEQDLFDFSIGGMRTFADITKELLAVSVPGVKEIALGKSAPLDEERKDLNTKEAILQAWDRATEELNQYYGEIPAEKFSEQWTAFGQYTNSILNNFIYYVENEIHHRGQGYVYLRALGIEPPFFWEK